MNTTCPYCGVGCGLTVKASGAAHEITGDPAHPANHGRLCVKGSTLAQTLDDSARLTMPAIGGRNAEWDEALDLVAARFAETVAKHGPDSVAFYVSGQFLTEDYYVANKLMKGFIGSANIDTNSRLCMASTVAGHIRAFGEDVVPGCYEDIDEADLLVFVGSNAAWCHPVLFERAQAARLARGTKIVVIDPRRTASAALADLHLPIRPDMDAALFNLLLVTMQERGVVAGAYMRDHTEGFAEALQAARNTKADAASLGLGEAELQTFLGWFVETERSVTLFSQGVNQSISGTDKVNAIINAHLASGRIGRPGMGPFSLTGQPNAMGGREVGGMANQLAAHLRFDDANDRALLQGFWNAPALPKAPGLKAVDLFEAVLSGKIRALWIAGTNPAESMPRASRVRAALEACPFVTVSDCWPTETTRLADVVLPAAGWSEKDGTVTNSERMISRQRGFRAAPGQAKPDWWMFAEVARRMGFDAPFAYTSPAEIFREHAALSGFGNDGRRLFDIGALATISDETYDQLGAVRWPCSPEGSVKRFFAEGGFPTATGRARFIAIAPPCRAQDAAFPFTLNTGRLRDQWHSMTRTGFVPVLMESASPSLALSPADAQRLGVAEGDLLRIATRHGSTVLPALITTGQRAGEVFAAMHWTGAYGSSDAIGRLAGPRTDPHSGQPGLKSEPAAIEALPVLWHGILQSRVCPAPRGQFSWWRLPVAGGMHRLHLSGWKPLPPEGELPDWAARLCGADPDFERIELADAGRGVYRLAILRGARLHACLFLARTRAGLPHAEAVNALFAVAGWQQGRAAILQASGSARQEAGKIVCLCHGVRDTVIRSAIRAKRLRTVAGIGEALQAGTNCGSCKGELAELLRADRLHAELQPA